MHSHKLWCRAVNVIRQSREMNDHLQENSPACFPRHSKTAMLTKTGCVWICYGFFNIFRNATYLRAQIFLDQSQYLMRINNNYSGHYFWCTAHIKTGGHQVRFGSVHMLWGIHCMETCAISYSKLKYKLLFCLAVLLPLLTLGNYSSGKFNIQSNIWDISLKFLQVSFF